MAILTKTNNTDMKIELFNIKHQILDKSNITIFLDSLPDLYSSIAKNGNRPLILNNAVNESFVRNLKYKGYISKYVFEEKGIRISTFKHRS
ncbi:hypothetical protein EZS27_007958 [termite gut metagenome]|uniref:Uncharacterized protein n=1 Tax=termite gut metagenome TaxID=433724 RepID=A0A5J4SGE0_9ZZZZ